MKIGVISDTHNFLDPRVGKMFDGVQHILHAGDVGEPAIIAELETIAPVTAVYGNTDAGLSLKETEIIELASRKFLIHHIVNPLVLTDKLKERIALDRPHAVVFGHTHKRFSEMRDGILFFNPGYAGKPKFGQERSVAILHCDKKEICVQFLAL